MASAAKYLKAEHDSHKEKKRHSHRIHPFQVGYADGDPDNDQNADHKAPYPCAGLDHSICRQRPVVDHNGCPAHKLQHIEHGKQQTSLFPEAHLYSLHCTFLCICPNEACQKKHQASDDVPDKNCCQPF